MKTIAKRLARLEILPAFADHGPTAAELILAARRRRGVPDELRLPVDYTKCRTIADALRIAADKYSRQRNRADRIPASWQGGRHQMVRQLRSEPNGHGNRADAGISRRQTETSQREDLLLALQTRVFYYSLQTWA